MISLLAALAIQSSMSPAEAAAYARVDQVGQYVVASAWCPRLGWHVATDLGEQIQERAAIEAASAGVDRATADTWAAEAVSRALAFMRNDLDSAVDQVGSGNERLELTRLFDQAEQRCQSFASDPISVGLISTDGQASREIARREQLDSMLEEMGQASWQTPAMFANAELLFALGACKPVLQATRHDEIAREFLPPAGSEGREERYLAGQYVQGLRASAELALDGTQCDRLMRGRLAAAR